MVPSERERRLKQADGKSMPERKRLGWAAFHEDEVQAQKKIFAASWKTRGSYVDVT